MKIQAYKNKNEKYLGHFNFDNHLDCKAFEYFAENDVDLKSAGIYEITTEIKAVELDSDSELKIGDEIEFEGYLSTFGGTDRANDTVLVGAFKRCLRKQKKYPFLKNHNSITGCQIGSFTAKEDDTGLLIKGTILIDENSIHEVRLLQKEHINTTSMGGIFYYKRNPEGYLERDSKGRFIIEEVSLFEGSLVPVPCNQDAKITLRTFEPIDEKTEPVTTEKTQPVSSTRDRYIELTKALKG